MYDKTYKEDVVTLVKDFHSESLHEFTGDFDNEKVNSLVDQTGDAMFLLIDDGNIVGMISGVVLPNRMSGGKMFQEFMWFVKPRYRTQGIRLLKTLEAWCRSNGVNTIMMAVMHDKMNDKLDHMYKKMGYKPIETHYMRRL